MTVSGVIKDLLPRFAEKRSGGPSSPPATGCGNSTRLFEAVGDSSRISEIWLIDGSYVVFGDLSYTSMASPIFAGLDEVIPPFPQTGWVGLD